MSLTTHAPAITGFVYVPPDELGAMRTAHAGAVVRNEGSGPPWIVVYPSAVSVLVGSWPGVLWRVHVTDAASLETQRSHGWPLPADANYTRAIAVYVVESVALAELFGPHGSRLLPLLDRTMQLTRDDATTLANHRHSGAAEVFTRLCDAWSTQDGSAVLDVLRSVATKRAGAVDGDAAFVADGDDDGFTASYELEAPWSIAVSALADAAMALGVPDLATEADRAILLAAWNQLVGSRST